MYVYIYIYIQYIYIYIIFIINIHTCIIIYIICYFGPKMFSVLIHKTTGGWSSGPGNCGNHFHADGCK